MKSPFLFILAKPALPITTVLLLAAAPTLGQVSSEASTKSGAKAQAAKSDGKLTVVSSESLEGDDVKAEAVEIRVDNGKVTVKRNGKEVPQDRLRHSPDGHLIILDESGEELSNLKLFMGGMHGGHGEGGNLFQLHGGKGLRGALAWAGAEGDDEPAPKVMLGLHMGEPGPALEKHLSLEAGKCTMITGVLEGLPAFEAGLGEYDVIVEVDGKPAGGSGSVREALANKEPGDVVVLRVIQSGKQKDIKITLEAFDAEKMHAAKLLGTDPEAESFFTVPRMHDLNIDLGNMELPNWQGRVLVAPQLDQWKEHLGDLKPHLEALEPRIRELQPMIEQYLREALQKHGLGGAAGEGGEWRGAAEGGGGDGKVPGAGKDVEAQLDRLDRRLADLEKMLQTLIERQAKP